MVIEPLKFVRSNRFRAKGAMERFGTSELPALPPAPVFDPQSTRRPSGSSYVMSREEEHFRFLQLNYAKQVFNKTLKVANKSARTRALNKWRARIRHLEEYIARVNMPLIYSQIARNASRYGLLDWDEAISECQPGLMRAMIGFNPMAGTKFSTYCCQIIHNCLNSANKKASKRRARLCTVELPDSFGDDGNEPRAVIRQEREDEVMHNLSACLSDNRAGLSRTERSVLDRRFGLNGVEAQTLEVIGLDMGVSKERVRQIQVQALAKLRMQLEGAA